MMQVASSVWIVGSITSCRAIPFAWHSLWTEVRRAHSCRSRECVRFKHGHHLL